MSKLLTVRVVINSLTVHVMINIFENAVLRCKIFPKISHFLNYRKKGKHEKLKYVAKSISAQGKVREKKCFTVV